MPLTEIGRSDHLVVLCRPAAVANAHTPVRQALLDYDRPFVRRNCFAQLFSVERPLERRGFGAQFIARARIDFGERVLRRRAGLLTHYPEELRSPPVARCVFAENGIERRYARSPRFFFTALYRTL